MDINGALAISLCLILNCGTIEGYMDTTDNRNYGLPDTESMKNSLPILQDTIADIDSDMNKSILSIDSNPTFGSGITTGSLVRRDDSGSGIWILADIAVSKPEELGIANITDNLVCLFGLAKSDTSYTEGGLLYQHTTVPGGISTTVSSIVIGAYVNSRILFRPASNYTSVLLSSTGVDAVTVESNGDVALNSGVSVNEISVDGGLASDSDKVLVTEKAIKLAITTAVGEGSAELGAHTVLTNNPHTVTKSQVSLGSVNNATWSDSYTLDSSATYATSKAVFDGLANHDTQHDDRFLQLTGGSVSNTLKFTQSSVNSNYITAYNDNIILGLSDYTTNLLQVGDGAFTSTLIRGGASYIWLGDSGSIQFGQSSSYISFTGSTLSPSESSTTDLGWNYPTGRWRTIYSLNPVDQPSDERLKDIEPIGDCSWLYDLEPIAFRWKADSVDYRYGFSAQHSYEVLPNKDSILVKKPEDEDDDWSMSTTELIPLLLKLVQEQKTHIDTLEVRLSELEQKVNL